MPLIYINRIYTQQRHLPASKVSGTQVERAIIADGSIITDAHIDRTVIGIRSVIGRGTTIRNSVLMGADFYQAEDR
jgi:glucose-1-phosphate adenylyltransferase